MSFKSSAEYKAWHVYVSDRIPRPWGEMDEKTRLLRSRVESHALFVMWNANTFGVTPHNEIAIPLDDDLAPGILDEVRARLGDQAPRATDRTTPKK